MLSQKLALAGACIGSTFCPTCLFIVQLKCHYYQTSQKNLEPCGQSHKIRFPSNPHKSGIGETGFSSLWDCPRFPANPKLTALGNRILSAVSLEANLSWVNLIFWESNFPQKGCENTLSQYQICGGLQESGFYGTGRWFLFPYVVTQVRCTHFLPSLPVLWEQSLYTLRHQVILQNLGNDFMADSVLENNWLQQRQTAMWLQGSRPFADTTAAIFRDWRLRPLCV